MNAKKEHETASPTQFLIQNLLSFLEESSQYTFICLSDLLKPIPIT